ncbi:hypothetical protein KSF_064280 [Reticulibacter mediterranei]|uniref:TraG P-loop domain-containing protein n=1 Tax=Reticulibacter mediterranei TaxID=2778369 RepID=A0A8J3IPZ7_9CHLR|nr:ATP-binding protein [Reticulibacter mediterranei]GHO96380.1 hypothetical protein KSF_064280 [Reticulibacter mediterranei]
MRRAAPVPPSLLFTTPMSIVKNFIRLREVAGDVVCLDLGRKNYEYRGILKIDAINFAFMSEEQQEGVIEGFKAFLNGISFPIQILVRNQAYDPEAYLSRIESIEGDLAEIAIDHAQFIRQLATYRSLIKREYYIIVPADYQNTKHKTEALINGQLQLRTRMEELLRQLERVGLSGRRLNAMEIIALYQRCLTPMEAQLGSITDGMVRGVNSIMESAYEEDRKPRSHVTSLSLAEQEQELLELAAHYQLFDEKDKKKKKKKDQKEKVPGFVSLPALVTPSSIEIFPNYVRVDGEVGHDYLRTLTITSYPRSAYPGWFESIIQIDEPYVDFSIHITPFPPEKVNARLGRKAVEFRGSVLVARRQGRTPDPSTTIALEDVDQLRESLARGDERVFGITACIQVRAEDRQKLLERSNRLVSTIRSLDFRALPAHWQHHLGMLSCLPDATNVIESGRLFGTGAASTFFPFAGSDIGMNSGVMFGIHPNGSLILINPFDSNQLENANMVVFAKSGAGKSFFLKTVSSRLLPTCNVYVIDPEAEYSNLCERVNGQYIRLSSDSLQINPFELYGQGNSVGPAGKEEGGFFREKLLNLITLLELLLSDDGTLPQKEKAFLYRCLVKTYDNRGITMDPTTHGRTPPNMQEFFVIMSSALRGDDRFGISEDVYGLSERLERYLHLFPTRTKLSLDNRFVNFNIRELVDTLKPVGLFIITEFLWTKMRQARRSQTVQDNSIVLIDEAWLLMKFSQGAKFLEEFARRIRKYGGGLWCTTQNSDDFLGSDEGKTILAMSTMKFLMKQDSSTIDSVMRTFNLSARQKSFLLGAKRGEGLFATKGWAQMEVVASPKEAEMANTTVVSTLSLQSGEKEKEATSEHTNSKRSLGSSTTPLMIDSPAKERRFTNSQSLKHERRS